MYLNREGCYEFVQVAVRILTSGVGDVTLSDVSLAAVSKATVLAFNVAADMAVGAAASVIGHLV